MKGKIKKVRAWAIAWTAEGTREYGHRGIISDSMKCTEFKEGSGSFELYDIFPDKEEAQAFLLVSQGDFQVVPCTITYTLPPKPIKRNTVK